MHTCAITDNGEAKCWGRNDQGQVGNFGTADQPTPQSIPLGSRTAVQVSSGYYHTCVVLDNGELKCWGSNSAGQLGLGTTTNHFTPQTVNLGAGRTAVSVAANGFHTCALLDNGELKCWGGNSNGQLGISSTSNSLSPHLVDLGAGRTAISVNGGNYHPCAILDNGELKCWGRNQEGQLGLGTTTDKTTPQLVEFPDTGHISQLETGFFHTCVIIDNASSWCWGRNGQGQLGIGTTAQEEYPNKVKSSFYYPHRVMSEKSPNTWFGAPEDVGQYNLDVWYNTSSNSVLHQVSLNVESPLVFANKEIVRSKINTLR